MTIKFKDFNYLLFFFLSFSCPLEPTIFPAVNVKNIDSSKSLSVPFQAFKFASGKFIFFLKVIYFCNIHLFLDNSIKFQMTISFCLDSCAVVR